MANQRHHHHAKGVFAGLPRSSPSTATTRWPSSAPPAPRCWKSRPGRRTAKSGVRHKTLPIEGVQFHPESILTEHGHAMLKNFWSSAAMIDAHQLLISSPPAGCSTHAGPRRRKTSSTMLKLGLRAGLRRPGHHRRLPGMCPPPWAWARCWRPARRSRCSPMAGAAYLLWMAPCLRPVPDGGNGAMAGGAAQASRSPAKVPVALTVFWAASGPMCSTPRSPSSSWPFIPQFIAPGAGKRRWPLQLLGRCSPSTPFRSMLWRWRRLAGAPCRRPSSAACMAGPRAGLHVHRLWPKLALTDARPFDNDQPTLDPGSITPCKARCSAPSSTAKSSTTRCCT